MTRFWKWTLPALILAAGVTFGLLVGQPEAQQKTVLVSQKVAAGPTLDGMMKDAYKDAQPLTFKVLGGRHLQGGATDVTMRSVYTDDMIYFLVQYKDPTLSAQREPWQKQADGSWKKLGDPNDKGGDNNLYYEDKISIFWNINSPAFDKTGCLSACHVGEGKPYGNMYTPAAAERESLAMSARSRRFFLFRPHDVAAKRKPLGKRARAGIRPERFKVPGEAGFIRRGRV